MAKSNAKVNVSRINRIKVVLVEQNKTGKWLSEQLLYMKLQFPDGVLMHLSHHWKC